MAITERTSASVNRSALCSVENVILWIFLLAPADKGIIKNNYYKF